MPLSIRRSVGRDVRSGRDAPNDPEDVRRVQILLNVAAARAGAPARALAVDGLFGPATLGAIREFQSARLGFNDGLVDPEQRTLEELNALAAAPDVRVLRPGDTSKADPYTIAFVANPALEAPWNSGTFVLDPIMGDPPAFDGAVQRAVQSLLGELPGQVETALGDPAIGPRVRIVAVFPGVDEPADARALVGQDPISTMLVPRRDAYAPLLAGLGYAGDVIYAVSSSTSHDRASAWYTTDNDSGPGVDFSVDGFTYSHRYYALIPGTVAIHSKTGSVTPLHEFGHAASSYSNGSITDLYVDNPVALNNKHGRPIPLAFSTCGGVTYESDLGRGGLGYPSTWQSYHCGLHDPTLPALMDDYWQASRSGRAPESCQHDRITRQFLRDRLLAKLSR